MELRTNSNVPSDIKNQEEKSPHERFRDSKTLFVTDFSSFAWCELQQHYSLIAGGRKETLAMKNGSEIHKNLESQEHVIVQIPTYTREDSWGIKLYNLIFGIDSLFTNYKTRELPIFGFVSDLFVFGIIDQVEMKPVFDDISGDELLIISDTNISRDELIISDTKTRTKPYIPKKAPPSVKFQLMLYKKLFDELVQGTIDDEKIFQTLDLNPDLEFSNELANIIKISCKESEIKELNLRNLMKVVINRFRKVWKTSNVLEVNYKLQKDESDLGSIYFDYNENQLENYLKKTIKYWKGDRKPEGVPIEDAWKCQNCDFADNCEWRLNKIKECEQKKRAFKEITNGQH
ncbi:exonuclease V [Rhizophagus clarus]|nr:exonuclease V [Rhizophagus clarus]